MSRLTTVSKRYRRLEADEVDRQSCSNQAGRRTGCGADSWLKAKCNRGTTGSHGGDRGSASGRASAPRWPGCSVASSFSKSLCCIADLEFDMLTVLIAG